MADSTNPFERFDLDPRLGPKAITERLRELAEDATPDERAAIRAAWEELTLHPLRRLSAALAARPETRPVVAPPVQRAPSAAAAELPVAALLPRPSVAAALGPAGPSPVVPPPRRETDPRSRSVALEEDPILEILRHVR